MPSAQPWTARRHQRLHEELVLVHLMGKLILVHLLGPLGLTSLHSGSAHASRPACLQADEERIDKPWCPVARCSSEYGNPIAFTNQPSKLPDKPDSRNTSQTRIQGVTTIPTETPNVLHVLVKHGPEIVFC